MTVGEDGCCDALVVSDLLVIFCLRSVLSSMRLPLLSLQALSLLSQRSLRLFTSLFSLVALSLPPPLSLLYSLGSPIRCSPPLSQSSSVQIINGVRSEAISLAFQVSGSRGSAMISVSSRDSQMEVVAQLGSGQVVRLNGSSSSSSEDDVIDVDARQL